MNIFMLQSLSNSDVQAIIAALPLILVPDFDTPDHQMKINYRRAESIGVKLLNRQEQIHPDELRVICLVVIMAKEYLAGQLSLSVEPEVKKQIQPFFFSYNKLYPSCKKMLEELEPHFSRT